MHRRTRRWWDPTYDDATSAFDADWSRRTGARAFATCSLGRVLSVRERAEAFDRHRSACAQCQHNPFALCQEGADLLIAEWDGADLLIAEWAATLAPCFPRPMSRRHVAALVASLLRRTCAACGASLIVHRAPGSDLDVLCPARLTLPRDEAIQHDYMPIDTGPFSLGRRVD